MFNVKNSLTILVVGATAASCGGGVSPEQRAAQTLYETAESTFMAGKPEETLTILDSLDSHCQEFTDIMRQSRSLRPRAIIADCDNKMTELKQLCDEKTKQLDSVAQLMKFVEVPATNGYYIPKNAKESNFMNSTGVSSRVDPAGQFYIVASLKPMGKINGLNLKFDASGKNVTTENATLANESLMRIDGSGIATFSPSMCDSVAEFFASLPPKIEVRVSFNNGNRKVAGITMRSDDFTTPAIYSLLINELRSMSIEAERLEARIELANNQIKRTSSKQEEK